MVDWPGQLVRLASAFWIWEPHAICRYLADNLQVVQRRRGRPRPSSPTAAWSDLLQQRSCRLPVDGSPPSQSSNACRTVYVRDVCSPRSSSACRVLRASPSSARCPAGHLAEDALAVGPEAETDYTAPATLAALVIPEILARRAFVIEIDGVLAGFGSQLSG